MPVRKRRQQHRTGSLELITTAEGKCWYLRYSAGVDERTGKPVRPRERIGLLRDFPSKAAASRAAAYLREQINRTPEEISAETRTFAAVIDRYRREELPACAFSTRENYERMIRVYLDPQWGHVRLQELKPLAVRAWLLSLHVAPRTRGHLHNMMRLLYRYAMLWEWCPIGENPMSLFRLPGSSKRQKDPEILTLEQCRSILAHIPAEPYRSMVIVAMCLGLRASEMVALKWRDVDFLKSLVRVERGIVYGEVGPVKTKQSKAPLPMNPLMANVLKNLYASSDFKKPDDWIFASRHLGGEMPYRPGNVLRRVLAPAAKKAGIPFAIGWHTFRHSYKSLLEEAGTALPIVQHLMRHSNIQTTADVYGRMRTERLRPANDTLVELLLGGQQ